MIILILKFVSLVVVFWLGFVNIGKCFSRENITGANTLAVAFFASLFVTLQWLM